jgi:hypothetical protein
VAEHPVAGATDRDAGELLEVDMDQLVGMAALVAVGRLGRFQPRALAEPDPLQPQRYR